MNNINLEKFIYKDLQSKGYDFYCRDYKSNSNVTPQIYAIKPNIATKQVLKQKSLKAINFTTQKIHNVLHKRPLIVVKSFNAYNPIMDNVTLCSSLKQGITQLPAKDIVGTLEKYITNIQPMTLVENVFVSSQDKVSYFKTFSKKVTLQNTNLKNLDSFLNKHCSPSEKEDFIVWFVSKRSKELQEIYVDTKITNYLLDTWKNDTQFLENFLTISPYLTNQIQNKDLDIFDSYSYSVTVKADIEIASKKLGLSINKISLASDKLFKSIEKYHNAHLSIINEKNKTTFLLESDESLLTKTYLTNVYKKFLVQLVDNNQKIDSTYCDKWYLHEVLSNKLPTTNSFTKVKKI